MPRSNDGPSFLVSAGARLTVIRFCGYKYPLFFIAERILSFDSFVAVDASPTSSYDGKPFEISVSIATE